MTVEEWQNELVSEVIRLRQEKGLTQKQLEQLSGVKQPVIARMETGVNIPQLATVIKLLEPLEKTLAVVPMESD
ncbi:MAG: helix-turn-helix domain-containing protein [Christensenellales bacterium]|jgi:predicted transcriptional regulator